MDASKLMSLMKDKKAAMKKHDKAAGPKPGKNRIMLLQGWRKGEEHVWYHEFGQHFIKNAAKEIKAVYPCAEATYGKPCAVCDGLGAAMRMTKDDTVIDLLGEAKAGKSVLINALDLDSTNPNTPVVYAIKRGVFSQIIDLIDEWGIKAFTQEIVITREGTGLNTKYAVTISPKEYAVPASVLEKLHDLDEYVKQESEEQLTRALSAVNSVVGIAGPSGSSKPSGAPGIGRDVPESSLDAEQEAGILEMEQAASSPVSSGGSLEEDLDSLLGEL